MPVYTGLFHKICWLLLLLCNSKASAQSIPFVTSDTTDVITWLAEPLGQEHGLSQGMVNGMVVDHQGYLWIATKEGLNRYDGYQFKVFRHHPDDPGSIGNNIVEDLFVDDQNRLWIEHNPKKLDLFDSRTESFIHFNYDSLDHFSVTDSLPESYRLADSEKVLLPRKETGTYDTLNLKGLYLSSNTQDVHQWAIANYYVYFSNIDNKHNLLESAIVKSGNEVFYRKIQTDELYILNNPHSITFNTTSLPPWPKERDFFGVRNVITENTDVYYMIAYGVLYSYSRPTHQMEPLYQIPGLVREFILFIDRQNRFWYKKDDGSYYCLQLDTGIEKRVDIRGLDNVSRMMDARCDFARDAQGNLWFGTNGYGLIKISGRSQLFTRQYHDESQGYLLRTDNKTKKAVYDTLAIYQHDKLIEKAPLPDTFRFTTYAEIEWVQYSNGDVLLLGGRKNQQNTIAFFRYSFETKSLQKIGQTEIPDGCWTADPKFLDRFEPVIWSGFVHSNGALSLYKLHEVTGQWTKYQFPIQSVCQSTRHIHDWHQDDNGVLWLGTNQGLFSFQPSTETWTQYQNEAGNPTSLSEDVIYSLWPDPTNPDTFLWVGTNGGGLNKMNKTTGSFQTYTINDGLPNNVIYAILDDDSSNLWLSTNQGLCLFNPRNLQSHHFTSADGLPTTEFNRYEYGRSADGALHFGGVDGKVHFYPEDYYANRSTSAILINQLKLENKPVQINHGPNGKGHHGFYLQESLQYTKELVLNYDDRMITLGFALLDLTTPSQNQYQYKLEGFNDTWVNGGNSNEATFTNLDPGRYVFKVRGSNSDGLWTPEPATLNIRVMPPWWATWWFRLLLVVVAGVGLFALYRYQLAQAVKMERLRNRIAQDLHDEIGSTISSVSLYAAVIEKDHHLSNRSKNVLEKIKESVSSMMESMNDIVWTISTDNDHFDMVVYRMRSFAANVAEAKGIQLHFNVTGQVEEVELNMEWRKNIYLIFKEAVNNAVKHAECNHLHVNISQKAQELEIKIQDDGQGFNPSEVNTNGENMGGYGLSGMKARAKAIQAKLEIHSAPLQGTTIELKIKV